MALPSDLKSSLKNQSKSSDIEKSLEKQNQNIGETLKESIKDGFTEAKSSASEFRTKYFSRRGIGRETIRGGLSIAEEIIPFAKSITTPIKMTLERDLQAEIKTKRALNNTELKRDEKAQNVLLEKFGESVKDQEQGLRDKFKQIMKLKEEGFNERDIFAQEGFKDFEKFFYNSFKKTEISQDSNQESGLGGETTTAIKEQTKIITDQTQALRDQTPILSAQEESLKNINTLVEQVANSPLAKEILNDYQTKLEQIIKTRAEQQPKTLSDEEKVAKTVTELDAFTEYRKLNKDLENKLKPIVEKETVKKKVSENPGLPLITKLEKQKDQLPFKKTGVATGSALLMQLLERAGSNPSDSIAQKRAQETQKENELVHNELQSEQNKKIDTVAQNTDETVTVLKSIEAKLDKGGDDTGSFYDRLKDRFGGVIGGGGGKGGKVTPPKPSPGDAGKASKLGKIGKAGKMGSSLLKKIPGVGLAAGIGLAGSALLDGDFVGAGLNLASGVASTVPGIGTAISLGLDGIDMARDLTAVTDNISAGVDMLPDVLEKAADSNQSFMDVIKQSQTPSIVDASTVNNNTSIQYVAPRVRNPEPTFERLSNSRYDTRVN
jgi:hypothetical protein